MNTKAIIYGVIAAVIAVAIYLIVRQVTSPSSPDEQESVSCGQKTVYRYKYPSKAFPVVANDYNAEVSFTSDVLKKIVDSAGSINIGVKVKNQVRELQEKLNQDNITFSTMLRNYFFSVNSDPCNDTLRIRYAYFTEEMSRRMLELRTITGQVANVTAPADTVVAVTGVDTMQVTTVPKYSLLRDSANLKRSMLKLDAIIEKNELINHRLKSIHGG